jgi:nucleoid DNA-binding protein
MFQILNSYLFQHKSISIPGLGTIFLEKKLPLLTEDGKNLLAPVYHFRFDKYFDAPDKDFFSHLAAEKKIADYEAMKLYNEFSYELRNKIRVDEKVEWEGVGVLKRDQEGNIVFESSAGTPEFLGAVPLFYPRHVTIKENNGLEAAENQEMSDEAINYPEDILQREHKWWIYSLIAAIIAITVLLFHFSYNGWRLESLGNQQGIEADK